MKPLIWTKQAINAGGKLSVQQVIANNGIVRARMDWDDDSIVGNISMSVEGALELLEDKLAVSATAELKEAGLV